MYQPKIAMVHVMAVRRQGVPAITEQIVPAAEEASVTRALAKQHETVFTFRRFQGVPREQR